MALDFAQDQDLGVVLDGKVLTSGASLDVSNGVLAIVENDAVSSRGRKVVGSFVGKSRKKDFQILLGKIDAPVTRSTTNKPYETLPFSLDEVIQLRVNAPKETGIKVDDFIIGYNGKAGSELKLDGKNVAAEIDITLCGDPIATLGYHNNEVTVKLYLETPYLDEDGNPTMDDAVTMQEIVQNAVKRFNSMTLIGNVPITDFVEAIVVDSTNEALDGKPFVFQSLTVEDAGTLDALAKVQAAYPTIKVVKSNRLEDTFSVYSVVVPQGTVLDTFETVLTKSFVPTCEECGDFNDEQGDGGFLYNIAIQDNGEVLTIDDFDGINTASTFLGRQNGVGVYSVLSPVILTDENIAAFLAESEMSATATITFVGSFNELCTKVVVREYDWVVGETCFANQDRYEVTVPDNKCGEARLAEIQAAYPDLTIVAKGVSTRTISLTGTSGTANIAINGVNYLATFATDLTTTANNFITTHKAAIEAANEGVEVTAAAGVISIVGDSLLFPSVSVVNVTTNLAGTVSAVSTVAESNMCQTTYATLITTNIVCEECDDEFRALMVSERPANFGLNVWEKVQGEFDPEAKMGIRFRAKEFVMSGTEYLRDDMPFYATSTRLKIAGGQPLMIAESWDSTARPFALKVLSIASEPEALGGHLWEREDQARFRFDGLPRFEGNNYGKWLWGQETRLKGTSQYIDFALTVHPKKYYQYMPHASEMITYHIFTKLGEHQQVEALLNQLAAAAGVETVKVTN